MPQFALLPGKDLLKVTTDSLILNNNSVWKKNPILRFATKLPLK